MSKVFIISDTWFNRPMENDPNVNVIDHNDYIINNWNNVVDKFDKVYVLGGFGIGDLYHIVVRLNGEIHFLDNYFNENEKQFMEDLRLVVKKSSDENINSRIIFEYKQMMILNDLDCFLSYYPLTDWSGKNTGTYCFHGFNDTLDILGHNITCTSSKWEGTPVNIQSIQENIQTFQNQV